MLLLTMSHNFFHHCLFYRFFLFSQKFVVPFSLTQMQVALLQLQKSIEKTSYVLLIIKILNLPIIDPITTKISDFHSRQTAVCIPVSIQI